MDVTARDDTEKLKWIKKGAERGNVFAQFNLGVAYLKANGVEKDYIEAYKWLNLAAAGGYNEAPAICNALVKKMDPADIAKAKRRVRAWKPILE